MKSILLTIIINLISFQISNSQWQDDIRLTFDPSFSNISYNNAKCIASNGENLHAVWWENRDGNYEIYYKRSTNMGMNWSSDTRLTDNIGSSDYPSVAVSGSVVHVVWQDSRASGVPGIYYKRSLNGGASWGDDIRLSDTTAAYSPSVTVFGNAVHVVFRDNRDNYPNNFEVYYKRSFDGGANWGEDTRLTNSSGTVYSSSVSISGQVLHVVWDDTRDGNYEIYYKRSTNNGISWGPDTRLTNNSADSDFPCVTVSGPVVHVVWQDKRDGTGNLEIYYKRSLDGGMSWETDKRLTNNVGDSWFPSVSSSGSAVHVVWRDTRDLLSGEIYYKSSSDGGLAWGTDQRLTNNSAGSYYPSISVSNQFVHIIWADTRNGNYPEIFYKFNPSGNSGSTFQSVYRRNFLYKPIFDSTFTRDTINSGYRSAYFKVLDVNLIIDTVLHTNDSDLEFYLTHAGITDTLIYRSGGSGDNFIGTFLNDSASLIISNGNPPFTGNYKPYSPLSKFTDMNAAGEWILEVYDRATGNTGLLNAWSLEITIQHNTIGIQPVGSEIPKSFSLSQNYPNPFNPKTKIGFDLHMKSDAKLIVYDILGRKVATLVDKHLNPGKYEIEWSADMLSSGVYFYRLQSGESIETKKMILLK